MPYIDKKDRINAHLRTAETPGQLNYQLTLMVELYRQRHSDSYQTFNDIVGALDNAKDEFRRRVQHPYEDKKMQENGDVYAPSD